MKRMLQHHAANGWGDDTAQPANLPAPAEDDLAAASGAAMLFPFGAEPFICQNSTPDASEWKERFFQ